MFFSLPKILALIGVIGAVWYGFRLLEAHRKSRDDAAGDSAGKDAGSTQKKSGPLDLEECRVCHAWVAGEACTREACTYSS